MKKSVAMRFPVVAAGILMCACGGGSPGSGQTNQSPAAAPTISTAPAQNGALIVTLKTSTAGATIHYTADNSAPTSTSPIYEAPFLVAMKLTVKAVATAPALALSSVTTQAFAPDIAPGTLVWSEEFNGAGQPDPATWTYDTGHNGFGNNEQENYCAWGSDASPCSSAKPNAYEGDGTLHIVARQPSKGVYTSARLKSQGLFSLMYGRIEARVKMPESQGMWPAFWLLGNNITTVDWPGCGELDIMEHIDGSNPENKGYDWVQSSVHGKGLDGGMPYHPAGFSAAEWHTYGLTWRQGKVEFYIDDPAKPYETFSANTMAGTWPFDQGPQFILLNLAVGGSWPGNVDATTVFPSEMLVDYVRIYTN